MKLVIILHTHIYVGFFQKIEISMRIFFIERIVKDGTSSYDASITMFTPWTPHFPSKRNKKGKCSKNRQMHLVLSA